jgi:hypothetical protein
MRLRSVGKWLVLCGAAVCGVGVALAFYAEAPGGAYYVKMHAETWCIWLVLAGLLAMFLGALIWAIRATAKQCLLAGLGVAGAGACIALFGRINVHGATAIFLPIIPAAALSAFLLGVAALIHYCRPKIGRAAYFVGMIPVALAGIVLFAEYWRESPNEGPPKVLTATKLSERIKSLPAVAHFWVSGLSFFDGKLYAGTNLGIVEILTGKVTRLYQFQSWDSVVSGPWLDRADHLLWALDERTHELLRFDGSKWTRMREPVPAKGYYPLGVGLEGVKPIGNADGFWLAAAGMAWRWESAASEWRQIPFTDPSDHTHPAEVIGVLPIGEHAIGIVRHEMLPFLQRKDEDFDFLSDELVGSDGGTAATIARDGKPFLADTWTVSGDAGYICTKERELIRVTEERVARMDAPGACEAVATDENLSVLAAIKGRGIFRLAQGQWALVAGSPYPSGVGEYWTHLAAASGQLAIAIDGRSVVDPQRASGADMHFVRNAPTSLWVLIDGKFSVVDF